MITIKGTAYDIRKGDQFIAKSNGHRITISAVDEGHAFFSYDDAPGTGAVRTIENLFDYYRLINR